MLQESNPGGRPNDLVSSTKSIAILEKKKYRLLHCGREKDQALLHQFSVESILLFVNIVQPYFLFHAVPSCQYITPPNVDKAIRSKDVKLNAQ